MLIDKERKRAEIKISFIKAYFKNPKGCFCKDCKKDEEAGVPRTSFRSGRQGENLAHRHPAERAGKAGFFCNN
ncbi:hypothetical protein EBO34_05130 [Alteribacter keqinensis]|uniref:Uncharacterized protein n=1 Tax=Alteribacter keqinensis TaxID=2483800 RepID=A0A3M7TVP8_9BACI|nr:hypothetical protein EBO34_05130 [Alteribacter keqinensis]